MAINKVQFQKGLSLNEFIENYGTEEQCFQVLYKLRWPEGFVCPKCGYNKCCQLTQRSLQQCHKCVSAKATAGILKQSASIKYPTNRWRA
ncbi:transposase [Zooshikella ganghwensis]|uniref:Transposase zinc-ribbon domain-containing protein n=1 Tax=Zooshikella ganghwensis TaxID=202772 RepID=A0A4P9VMM4_9GAMM|nr:hypothetical protein B9G39_06770 [Zooshikella ganghwensis]